MLWQKTLSILLLISIFSKGIAQKGEDITKYGAQFISLPKADKKYSPGFPISAVEVFDSRFDTTNVGIIQKPSISREKMIHLKYGTIAEINTYLKSLIIPDSTSASDKAFVLVCFIKRLLLSDKIYIRGGDKVSSKDPVYDIKSGGMTMLEFYARLNDDFLPLYRFDTTIAGENSVLIGGKDYLAELLKTSLIKLETINIENLKAFGKPKSFHEIDSFNTTRFNIPILKESLQKGIYITFKDFKNNTPIDTPFTVEKGRLGDFLYIKNQKNEEILQTQIWGYSDGQDSYIYSAENYFKLIRHKNAFIIYGAKVYSSSRNLRLNFNLIDVVAPNSNYSKARTVSRYKLVLNFFQLDMENGELY